MGSILMEMHDKVCNLGVLGENDTESCSHLVEEHDKSAKLEEDLIKRSVAVLLIALFLLFAFQATIRVEVAKAGTQPIWPMEGYDTRHTGQCPYDTSTNNGNLEWKFKTGEKIWSSQAIGSDGTIYTGSRDRYLYALNPDGTLRWKFKTGGWIVSSPAVASDGTVYAGSRDEYFYAINPDGTLKWKVETGDVIYSSPAVASDGTIYVGANINHVDIFNFLQSYLYALNPDGTLKWKFKAGRRIQTSPAIAPDGTIYVGSNDWHLYALNPDGTLKWKYRTSHWIISASVSSPAISLDGTVYVASWDGYLSAISPDGTLKWTFKTGWPGAGPFQHLLKKPPAWMTAGLDEITSSPVISLEGTIYIGSNNNYLYALHPDGTLKWKFGTGDGIFSSPRISPDGTVYVGSWDGYLYAIGNPQ